MPFLTVTSQQSSLQEWMKKTVNISFVHVFRRSQYSFSILCPAYVKVPQSEKLTYVRSFQLSSVSPKIIKDFLCRRKTMSFSQLVSFKYNQPTLRHKSNVDRRLYQWSRSFAQIDWSIERKVASNFPNCIAE